ncbi:CBS domain-containing protein [Anaerovorax sp. IOR16]|uniref:CBS domain-containing protein n=1 Tax=Anaerovorax sp. IOR16 TaxID=2773458 RepID=UPI0019D04AC9|nr:CBS domain-containing protein [Anaerovorax sp. IOR16]
MKVKELMTTSVTWVRPDTSLSEIAKYMKQENIGSLPVCTDRGEPVGIITDRDMVLRAMTEPGQEKTAQDIMTKNLVYANPEMNTHEASMLLAKHQVRRLPVVENSKLVGMLAMADIARKPIYVDEAGDALNAISKPSTIN